MMYEPLDYEPPRVVVLEVEVELGFNMSGENGNEEWM